MTTSTVPRELQIPHFWGHPHEESDEECKPIVSHCIHIRIHAFGGMHSHVEHIVKDAIKDAWF